MMKFDIGDTARLLSSFNNSDYLHNNCGFIDTVDENSTSFPYTFRCKGLSGCFGENELEEAKLLIIEKDVRCLR